MIFISTGCSKESDLNQNIDEIFNWGFREIELTGGIQKNEDIENILIKKAQKHNAYFQCHNYFPPPEKPFVLNLSGEEQIIKRSRELIGRSLDISKKLNSKRYGIHAGFRVNPEIKNLGDVFNNDNLTPLEVAENKMIKEILEIEVESSNFNIDLYIENNVYSNANKNRFKENNPFLLTCYEDFIRISKKLPKLNVLLDIGHLKVSCTSLGLNYEEELSHFLKVSNYIHISDNNGLSDQNLKLSMKSENFSILKNLREYFKPECVTVEVYSGVSSVKETVKSIEKLL